MPRLRQIEFQTFRNYRLEVDDDGGDGWLVTIYDPDLTDRSVLRTSVPGGLAELLDEAHARIDRRLDGRSWDHERN